MCEIVETPTPAAQKMQGCIDMDRDTIIGEIKGISAGRKTLPKREFLAKSGISERQIRTLFDGWNEAVRCAGLTPTEKDALNDDVLFRAMMDAFINAGAVCSQTRFEKLCAYSEKPYRKRFGRWDSILSAFRAWLEATGESFPFLDQLPKEQNVFGLDAAQPTEGPRPRVAAWQAAGTTTYGSFLNFRGLQHAPVNEQGVVLLFGMVCFELGFVIEAVRNDYPDCEAKRRVNRSRDQWERVRIEFEHRSSNFRDHGHDAKNCDVIVCWDHNWAECPLEVIELKTEIQRLSASV